MGSHVDHGPGVFALCMILIFFSTVLVVARFYVRHFVLKNLGPDDWAALAALLLVTAMSSLDAAMTVYGTGRHLINVPPAHLEKFFGLLPTAQLLFFTASVVTRLSILLFLRRLMSSYKPLWPAIVVLVMYWIAFFFAFLLQCHPVKALWNRAIAEKCLAGQDEAIVMYIHGGVGVLFDIALLVAPMILLWQRLMFRKMKFRMLAIFSVGLFACVAGIARLAIITTVDMTKDTTWNVTRAAIWTNLEVHVGLIVGCSPAIHPIFRWVRKKLTGQSTTKDSKYLENTPATPGAQSKGYGWGRSMGTDARGREELELYSIRTKVERRGTDNDSQEAIVQDGGIYKHTDVEVRVDDRVSETGEEASVKSEDRRRSRG
ncbi:hypothetical protein EDC01DRAFT_464571 [Geopyxis carbonaria]|nr:hypothetical protein EDC01DRAFT_464571 [Geopyxis carbonaria]